MSVCLVIHVLLSHTGSKEEINISGVVKDITSSYYLKKNGRKEKVIIPERDIEICFLRLR